MIYIFDSDSLIDLFKHYYPERFPSLWVKFNALVSEKRIISVREVFNELINRGDKLSEWVASNHSIFHEPTNEEMSFVTEIFEIKHFQALIREKARLVGKPVADPFLIAKAKVGAGCVVTQERYSENAAKIPNVCNRFEIPCVNLETFMEKENWTF